LSLFWYYACVPDLVGEPMDQWGNPESKVHAWMSAVTSKCTTCGHFKVHHLLRVFF
jgi:hypothetical protein